MPISTSCEHCGWEGTRSDNLAGLKTKCPSCGEPMKVPDVDDVKAKRAALNDFDHEDLAERTKDQRRGPSVSGGAVTGILMMVGAAIWFIAGLAVDRIFFYPPILFVLGIIQLVRSLSGRPG